MRSNELIELFGDHVDLLRGIVLQKWIMQQLRHPAPIAWHDGDHPQVRTESWRAYKGHEYMQECMQYPVEYNREAIMS